jgi:hypothetical protein
LGEDGLEETELFPRASIEELLARLIVDIVLIDKE